MKSFDTLKIEFYWIWKVEKINIDVTFMLDLVEYLYFSYF